MRLQWLAIGVALGGLAWLLPWVYFKVKEPKTFYVLSYTRDNVLRFSGDEMAADPGADLINVSDYPVQIAVKCKIGRWTVVTNSYVPDARPTARIRFSEHLIDDKTFNCLADFLKTPNIRLERGPELPLEDYYYY